MTPVETIARAIYKADRDAVRYEAETYEPMAQAALSALLTPSESMVEAGMEQGPIGCCNASDKDIRDIWQAMVQAAMREGRE